MDKAKRLKEKVKYWITYRLPGGKQRRECVGFSVEDAKAADGKRKGQKKEGRIFEMLPESVMTFSELADWFLGLEKVKAIAYYPTLHLNLQSFKQVFGHQTVGSIRPADLENYQAMRKRQELSDSYIDQEIGAARNMVNKAFDNDLVNGEAVKAFRKVKKPLKRNANARDRILTKDQFISLMKHLPRHTKTILSTGFYTGMRKGEILNLTWNKVDFEER
jgi:integrase